MSTTAQTDLTTLQSQLGEVGDSLTNIEDAKTLRAAQASAKTGVSRLQTAQGTLTAAIQALNPTPPPPPPPSNGPNGPSGSWNLVELLTPATYASQWKSNTNWTNQNGVTDLASNVLVTDTYFGVQCSDAADGAAIMTQQPLILPDYCYNFHALFPAVCWNAVWGCTEDNSPASEYIEFDNAEFLNNKLSCTTHGPSGVVPDNQNVWSTYPAGTWTGAYHDFTVWRNNGTVSYYWDGLLVKQGSYPESGAPMFLVVTAGNGQNNAFGANQPLQVAEAQVWAPA